MTSTVTIQNKRTLLVCVACTNNIKPRLVWIENGTRYYAGRGINENLLTGVISGRCTCCNKVWKYQRATNV